MEDDSPPTVVLSPWFSVLKLSEPVILVSAVIVVCEPGKLPFLLGRVNVLSGILRIS